MPLCFWRTVFGGHDDGPKALTKWKRYSTCFKKSLSSYRMVGLSSCFASKGYPTSSPSTTKSISGSISAVLMCIWEKQFRIPWIFFIYLFSEDTFTTSKIGHLAGAVEGVATVQPRINLDNPEMGHEMGRLDTGKRLNIKVALSTSLGFGGLY